MSRVRTAFNKLQAYYKANNPDGLNQLAPPATDNDIKELAKLLPTPMVLPLGYVELLKIHNGGNLWVAGWEFLSIKQVIRVWTRLAGMFPMDSSENRGKADPDNGIKNFWYDNRWMPIFGNGGGDYICVDYDPGPSGHRAQIIEHVHDFDARTLHAQTFEDWFVEAVDKHIEITEIAKVKAEEATAEQIRKAKIPVWLRWVFA
jgi:cell wall assembly regulator SMI1